MKNLSVKHIKKTLVGLNQTPRALGSCFRHSGSFWMSIGMRKIRFTDELAVSVIQQCTGILTIDEIISQFDKNDQVRVKEILKNFYENQLITNSGEYERFHEASNNPSSLTPTSKSMDEQTNIAIEAIKQARYEPPEKPSKIVQPIPTELGRLICSRRSVRKFSPEPVSREVMEHILVDSVGIVGLTSGLSSEDDVPLRAIPQSGAITAVEGRILTLKPSLDFPVGIYHLCPFTNGIYEKPLKYRVEKVYSALNADLEPAILSCSAILIISARLQAKTFKYGDRGYRYILMEVGCSLQNALLSVTEQGLAAFPYGGFNDRELSRILEIDYPSEIPLVLVVIGRQAKEINADSKIES